MEEKKEIYRKSALLFVIIKILFPVIGVIGIFISDVILRTGGFDISLVFTGKIYYGYNFSFLESVFSIDRFVGEFLKTFIISIALAGVFLTIYRKDSDFDSHHSYQKSSKTVKFIVVVLIIIVIILNFAAIVGFGIIDQHSLGSMMHLITLNYFPDFFSYSLLTYLSLIPLAFSLSLGFKFLLDDEDDWSPSKKGINFLLIYFIVLQIMLFIFPINRAQFASSYIPEDLVFTWLEIFFISGLFSSYYYRKRKLLNVNDSPKIHNSSQKLKVWLRISFICFIFVFIIIIFSLVQNQPHFALTAFGLLQRFFIFVFRFCLTIFLYNYYIVINTKQAKGSVD